MGSGDPLYKCLYKSVISSVNGDTRAVTATTFVSGMSEATPSTSDAITAAMMTATAIIRTTLITDDIPSSFSLSLIILIHPCVPVPPVGLWMNNIPLFSVIVNSIAIFLSRAL